jgi:UDP-glucose 4-epimerase
MELNMRDPISLPTALVTGAAGFIGSHVVRALLARGRVKVIALEDLSGGFIRNLPKGVEFVEGSVTDHAFLTRLFDRYRFRYVYHLAAYAAEGLSHFIRRFNYTNNVIGSVNLINEAVRHEVDCFVFTSSIAVYGAITPPMSEDQTPRPEDPYGIAKLAIELDLAAAGHMFGLPYVIFRPHNVYGEYQNLGDPYRNVIGIFMNQIMSGNPMTVFGDGIQRRAFSYVGDIIPAIVEAPWAPGARGEVFNIGADTSYSINELTEQVALAMGRPGHSVQHLPPRDEVMYAYSDHRKAERVFGTKDRTPLQEGLKRMASWALRVGIQRARPFEGVEVSRNLPPSWRNLLSGGHPRPTQWGRALDVAER